MNKVLMVSLIIVCTLAATKDEWKNRSVYQLLTDRFATSRGASSSCNLGNYCGGDYQGMIQNLDYVQNLGFDAIWISPVVDNRDGGYHGYWARNMYKTNDHFGSAEDLKALVQACHSRGIWVMVDIVANHMGNEDTNYSQNNPFTDASHYHDWCEISDSDFGSHNLYNIERCRLAKLADLNQDNEFVANELIKWIQWLITEFQFDGIRIDTFMMVKNAFWKRFTDASGVYSVGEVFDGDMNFLKQFIGPVNGLLNYPFFYQLRDVFLHQRDMGQLESFYNSIAGAFGKDNLKYMGNFNDNHDNARFLSDSVGSGQGFLGDQYSDLKKRQFKSLTAFTMTAVGIPMIYYGSEQLYAGGNDPQNREVLWNNLNQQSEMYQFIKTINAVRKSTDAGNQDQVQRYADAEFYAFTRGKLFAAFSSKYDRTVTKTITFHPYSDGQVLCNAFNQSDCVTVQSKAFSVTLVNGEIKLYAPK